MKRAISGILLLVLVLFSGCAGNSDHAFRDQNDLRKARVGVLMGSTHDTYITEQFSQATILRLNTEPDLLVVLDSKKADAIVIDGSVYSTTYGATGKYAILDTLFTEKLGIGFNLNNPELHSQFNAFLAGIRTDGTYDQILADWFGDGGRRMPEWDDMPDGIPIKMAVTGTTEGFAFVRDGMPAGFDIELLTRFCRSIGRPLEFSYVNFGGLIVALASGKVDVIASGITITEERSKQVAFSDPYFISQSIAIVLKERYESGSTSAGTTEKRSGWRTVEEVRDKRFGVLMSSIQDEYITDHFPKAKVIRLDMAPDLIMALKTGQCDAIVLPQPEAREAIKADNHLAVLEENLFMVDFGVGFRDEVLRGRFDAYLAEIRQNGQYDQMVKRWIGDTDNAVMPELEFPAGAKPLVVGTTAQSIPFSFIKNGINSGFDMELVSRFAEKEGRPLKFETMTFGGLIPALKSGRIDVLASSAMMTQDRKKQVLFSDPYYSVPSSVLILRKNLAVSLSAKDGSDLASSAVGAMTGTTGEMFIEAHYPDASLSLFDDINDAIAAMRAGKIDYAIMAYTTALLAARNNADLRVLPEEYVREPAAIALRKDNTALAEELNALIRRYRADGTLEQIADRWVNKDGAGYTGVENVPGPDAPVLRVAVAANREPMCFIRENRVVGLDSELIERLAAALGMRVEYLDVKFSALINMLESKRADVVISNFTATEERKKKVLFTEDYFTNPQVLLTVQPVTDGEAMDGPGFFARVKESFYNNLILEKRWKLIVEGLKATLLITLFATLLGTVFGGLVCAMRMSRRRLVNGFAKVYINVMRGTPLLVLLMIFFYVIFASTGMTATVVAIITFALNMGAYSSEMFRTAIEGVDPGQKEAGIAMGFTKLQTFVYIILPQAVRKVIPVYKGEVISLLKMTSVVGYIAVVDLTKASDIIRSRTFDAFFPLIVVAVIYFLLAWLLGLGLESLNNKVSSSK